MSITERERDFILEYGRQACELFPEQQWVQVGPFLQGLWDEHHGSSWDEVEPLMRSAWEKFCGGHLAGSDPSI